MCFCCNEHWLTLELTSRYIIVFVLSSEIMADMLFHFCFSVKSVLCIFVSQLNQCCVFYRSWDNGDCMVNQQREPGVPLQCRRRLHPLFWLLRPTLCRTNGRSYSSQVKVSFFIALVNLLFWGMCKGFWFVK